MGRFHPPDHSKGDANTIGGYHAVHSRPAAFEGSDGRSYSVEIVAGESGEAGRPFGAYLLFVRWSAGEQPVLEGHLESGFLGYGATGEAAIAAVSALPLSEAKRTLEALLAGRA